ncbi:hypothetical protein HHK36_030395 [Tetracentron sinense]|uniref:COBRA-like protein n=1 Tax=Tetracentron sinense TaxID=13715 RepID=A0A835D1I4_TETSI|nr:hypothetical protein HHK36_030395 [Tetracentron sinense]
MSLFFSSRRLFLVVQSLHFLLLHAFKLRPERFICHRLKLIMFLLLTGLWITDGQNTVDLDGNVTITWDIVRWQDHSYDALVTITNFHLYRHIESPGWRLSWTWKGDEVVWQISGAEAAEQGNCSRFMGDLPHSCEKTPEVIDLLPGAPYDMQVANCCKGGVLSSKGQDPLHSQASFQMNIGESPKISDHDMIIPKNFSLGLAGYTCGSPFLVRPSKFTADNGRRHLQALISWKIRCLYSPLVGSTSPSCCVSLSAFYSETILDCAECSCGCQGAGICSSIGESWPLPYSPPVVRCTRHMCPIRVHWHVKSSSRGYWRVEVTIWNFNLVKNYTNWNLVVQHPSLDSVVQVFSSEYKPLSQRRMINDTGLFWGSKLQSGENGVVQTEVLLRKDPNIFTFKGGWTFPRKVYFNGDECVMPPRGGYPRLPKRKVSDGLDISLILLPLCLLSFFLSFIWAFALRQRRSERED